MVNYTPVKKSLSAFSLQLELDGAKHIRHRDLKAFNLCGN